MIKFFRKIRQRLLNQNRFSSYLVYALGEIILVVIGILIALQINNWSEENKNIERQKNYLKLVKTEMSNNFNAIHLERVKMHKMFEGLKELLAYSAASSTEIDQKAFSLSWNKVFIKSINFEYVNGALTEILSSGVLKEIKNESIRNKLSSWDGKVQKVLAHEKDVNAYIQKGNNYLEKNGNVVPIFKDKNSIAWSEIKKLTWSKSDNLIINNQEFRNILLFTLNSAQTLYNEYYIRLLKDIENLMREIDYELSQEFDDAFRSPGTLFAHGIFRPDLHYSAINSNSESDWYYFDKLVMCVDYPPNLLWGSFYITIGRRTNDFKESKDFSKFKKLIVELKGEEGGEELQISLKDVEDPDDGNEDRYNIRLTKEWKTYQIDLRNNFASADLKNLHVVSSFNFSSDPQKIYIKKIYFK